MGTKTVGYLDSLLIIKYVYMYIHIYIYTLEVNHHLKNGGSFWKIVNPY